MKKTAILIGATGLTGNELLNQLVIDNDFDRITLFSRKALPLHHSKLTQHTIDFNNLKEYETLIKGDVVFCCLGTTIKSAGSKEAFKKVDFTYPYEFAKIAKHNGVPTFCLQSSTGADENSSNFYLKTKGETERAIELLKFQQFGAFRPSMLLGKREEFRLGEMIGKIIMNSLAFLFIGKLKRYKAIHVKQVAKAMMNYTKLSTSGNRIIENESML